MINESKESDTIAITTPYRFYGIDGEVIMTHNGVATVIDIEDGVE